MLFKSVVKNRINGLKNNTKLVQGIKCFISCHHIILTRSFFFGKCVVSAIWCRLYTTPAFFNQFRPNLNTYSGKLSLKENFKNIILHS